MLKEPNKFIYKCTKKLLYHGSPWVSIISGIIHVYPSSFSYTCTYIKVWLDLFSFKSACVMFIKSIKSVGPLLFIYVLMQVIFAIMAVQLLQGKLFYCNDTTKLTRDQCRYEPFWISLLWYLNIYTNITQKDWKMMSPRKDD